MEHAASHSGDFDRFIAGGRRQLLSDHLLRQELCFSLLCELDGL